jgi:hypothetical protein
MASSGSRRPGATRVGRRVRSSRVRTLSVSVVVWALALGACGTSATTTDKGVRGSGSTISTPETTGPPLLSGGFGRSEVLASLVQGQLWLTSIPSSWQGPYAICSSIEAGWADCIDISSDMLRSAAVSAYLDPRNPTLQIWLLDDGADTSAPLALLSDIDLSDSFPNGARQGFGVSVELPTTPSAQTAISDYDGTTPLDVAAVTVELAP